MRHKILDALDCVRRDTVGGIVEMDEMFLPESFKGNHRKGGREIPRKAHKRGKSIRKRGLSGEQICIGTAMDRSGNLIMGMTGHGRVSYAELERLYDGHVMEGSTLCTDSLNSYRKMASLRSIISIAYTVVSRLGSIGSMVYRQNISGATWLGSSGWSKSRTCVRAPRSDKCGRTC